MKELNASIIELANERGLTLVAVSEGDAEIVGAVAGFHYFSDARRFAEETGGRLVLLSHTLRDTYHRVAGEDFGRLLVESVLYEDEVVLKNRNDLIFWCHDSPECVCSEKIVPILEIADMLREKADEEVVVMNTTILRGHIAERYTTTAYGDDTRTKYEIAVMY